MISEGLSVARPTQPPGKCELHFQGFLQTIQVVSGSSPGFDPVGKLEPLPILNTGFTARGGARPALAPNAPLGAPREATSDVTALTVSQVML